MTSAAPGYAFDEFEYRARPARLLRNGESIALSAQPLRLLELFLESGGEIVSHAAIRERLWPGQDLDATSRIHTAVRQVRRALDDDGDPPKYVETLPRLGYRFLAPVTRRSDTGSPGTEPTTNGRRVTLVSAAILLVVGGFAAWLNWGGDDAGGEPGTATAAAFLDGRALLDAGDDRLLLAAIEVLGEAVKESPGFAPARASLSEALFRAGDGSGARAQALEAVAADPTYARGHLALAYVEGWVDHDWEAARDSVDAALALTPDAPEAWLADAWLKFYAGQRQQAIAAAGQALASSQAPPGNASLRLSAATLYYLDRQFESAGRLCAAILRDVPGSSSARRCLYHLALVQQDFATALEQGIALAELLADGREVPADLAEPANPEQSVVALERWRAQQEIADDPLAAAYSAVRMRRYDDAFFLLGRSLEARSPGLPEAMFDPLFIGLHHQSAFVEMRREMGLVAADE